MQQIRKRGDYKQNGLEFASIDWKEHEISKKQWKKQDVPRKEVWKDVGSFWVDMWEFHSMRCGNKGRGDRCNKGEVIRLI